MKRNCSGYVLLVILIVFFWGCAKKIQVEPTEKQKQAILQVLKEEEMAIKEIKPEKPAVKVKSIGEEIREVAGWDIFEYAEEQENSKCTEYVVGIWPPDCLWNIAGMKEIYNDPLQWKRIYNANKDKIKNPDLIYQYQVLKIPRR